VRSVVGAAGDDHTEPVVERHQFFKPCQVRSWSPPDGSRRTSFARAVGASLAPALATGGRRLPPVDALPVLCRSREATDLRSIKPDLPELLATVGDTRALERRHASRFPSLAIRLGWRSLRHR
jgi:hypothetical protein